MYTAPAVKDARKHMMVITTVKDRPVTEPAGTIGVFGGVRGARLPRLVPDSRSMSGGGRMLRTVAGPV
jgi:hypothetical protein